MLKRDASVCVCVHTGMHEFSGRAQMYVYASVNECNVCYTKQIVLQPFRYVADVFMDRTLPLLTFSVSMTKKKNLYIVWAPYQPSLFSVDSR